MLPGVESTLMSCVDEKAATPSYDEALQRILSLTPTLGTERAPLDSALGRVLRQEVLADRDQPPFDRSAMDGFALRSNEVAPGASWRIDGEVPAGDVTGDFARPLSPVTARRIATGAPLPPNADAVVPVERALLEGDSLRLLVDRFGARTNVHAQGSDAKRGQTLLAPGVRLTPQHLGIAAAVGAVELQVAQRPRVTLLTTGDEVLPPERVPGPQQIRNSNSGMARALLASLGLTLLHHQHVPDELEPTVAAAREALSHSHLVLSVGGVSVGQRDCLPLAWARLGLRTVVHGVNIQPGKPLLLACDAPEVQKPDKLVVGLPGNPVSVWACFHLFVWPILRRMLGQHAELPWRQVTLAEQTRTQSKRELFRGARMLPSGSARVIGWQGSGDLVHTAQADTLLRLPRQDDPVPAGTSVRALRALGCE